MVDWMRQCVGTESGRRRVGDAGKQTGGDGSAEHGEERQAGTEAVFPDVKVGDAWGESITTGRAFELDEMLQAWEQEADHGERKGPFHQQGSGPQLTGADVFWLAARTLAGTSEEQAVAQAMDLLRRAQEDVRFPGLNLSWADLVRANLAGANLGAANLAGARLAWANLAGAELGAANLAGAGLAQANLAEANLGAANLAGAFLREANLSGANLSEANLAGANSSGANLAGASLAWANLTGACLAWANLTGARLDWANLSSAKLSGANLTSARLPQANLSGAALDDVRLNVETDLRRASLSTTTLLADIVWNAAPLAGIAWESVPVIGDETLARQHRDENGKQKSAATRLREYEAAVRAYRLLAAALRDHGLYEHADRFAYRAHLMQRGVLRRQALLWQKGRRVGVGLRLRKLATYLSSGVLDLVAGFGYRPLRSVVTYALVICAFAGLYLLNGQFAAPHLRWDEALVLSVSSFHGRGFFTSGIALGDTLARLAAGEAIVGLLLEITFIATFTQRFFGR